MSYYGFMVIPLLVAGLIGVASIGGAVIAHQKNVSMPQYERIIDDPFIDGLGDKVRSSDEDLGDDEDVSEEEYDEIALSLRREALAIERLQNVVPDGVSVGVSDEFLEEQEELLEETEGADNIFVS